MVKKVAVQRFLMAMRDVESFVAFCDNVYIYVRENHYPLTILMNAKSAAIDVRSQIIKDALAPRGDEKQIKIVDQIKDILIDFAKLPEIKAAFMDI